VSHPGDATPHPSVRARTDRPAEALAPRSGLLIDQFLPRFDVGVVHAGVFPAAPAQRLAGATELDLFQTPLVRALIGIRGWPQRMATTLRRPTTPAALEASRPTFRFRDMVDLGWILLGEAPGREMVLGQVSRPWKGVAVSAHVPTTPEQFAGFEEPGFAKIAASIRVDPYGAHSSILTMETRVAVTDEASRRRRFRRYWLAIGPFSSLIRRMALRELRKELGATRDLQP